MDPKIVRMAKDVPARFKEVMNHMFEASEPALRSGVSALRGTLTKLDHYLQQVEREHLGTAPASAPAYVATHGASTAKKTRRRRGRFGISDFILDEIGKSPKGLRPFEISARLAEKTGRGKDNATSNVNTALSRLRKSGLLVSRDGLYTRAGAGAAAASTFSTAASAAGSGAVRKGAAGASAKGPKRAKTRKK